MLQEQGRYKAHKYEKYGYTQTPNDRNHGRGTRSAAMREGSVNLRIFCGASASRRSLTSLPDTNLVARRVSNRKFIGIQRD